MGRALLRNPCHKSPAAQRLYDREGILCQDFTLGLSRVGLKDFRVWGVEVRL